VITIALAAAIGIFLLLQAALASWRLATLVFLVLPMALSGGVVAALLAGGTITLGSVAGLAAVLGLAARGSVMLVRHYQRLHREGEPFGSDLVLRGAGDRLVPILMTALGTAVVLLPLAFGGDAAGLEVLRPMALVILGGLLTSTALNLFVLPALYLRHGFTEPDTATEDLFVEIPEVEAVAQGGGPARVRDDR
jgi:Cu/Ag efflux pump CusA